MSKGEKEAFGNLNPAILANVFEAIVGAIYLDTGLENARNFVVNNLIIRIVEHYFILFIFLIKNYKTGLAVCNSFTSDKNFFRQNT